MFFALLSALTLSLSAQASSACSRCRGYGTVFGPIDDASYACYSVVRDGKVADAFRFSDLDSCWDARGANPDCARTAPAPEPADDPCWRL